jgi:hypothetical protein
MAGRDVILAGPGYELDPELRPKLKLKVKINE